ncbi:hypothetical protein T03_15287 [Trichinella britovi]|uniref:Uncharacterized protein n=2 Tax=Trichinella TaxID=6333 RepID=A0A0V1D880_TRIBR|nr:hypothetical protein T03_15287 [Trichinella britovi]
MECQIDLVDNVLEKLGKFCAFTFSHSEEGSEILRLIARARKWCTSSDRMDTRYACDGKVRRCCSKCFLCAALITLFKTAEIAL